VTVASLIGVVLCILCIHCI